MPTRSAPPTNEPSNTPLVPTERPAGSSPAALTLGDLAADGIEAGDVDRQVSEIAQAVERLEHEALSAATRRSYTGHLRRYQGWCAALFGTAEDVFHPASPKVIELFLLQLVGRQALPETAAARLGFRRDDGGLALPKPTTVFAWCAAIEHEHLRRRLDNPFSDPEIQRLRRNLYRVVRHEGTPKRRARPLVLAELQRLVAVCLADGTLAGLRDAALLYVGFASGGRRRSELAGLRLEQLRVVAHADGPAYAIAIVKRKRGSALEPELAPVMDEAARVLARYLEAVGLEPGAPGPVFRRISGGRASARGISGNTVWRIMQDRVAQAFAELPAAARPRYSPHSLRHGFLTECGLQGVSLENAMRLSLHKDIETALTYQAAGA